MRSIYWKIFLSFWLTTILTILSVAWFTQHVAENASIPEREKAFMDSYATAAVATYSSGDLKALKQWLRLIGLSEHMSLYLVNKTGDIINNTGLTPAAQTEIETRILPYLSQPSLIKSGNLIISHPITSQQTQQYRLVAISDKPLSQYIAIQWAGLTVRILIAVVVSGLICYLLSRYLTKPLRILQEAARQIASGKLDTRAVMPTGYHKDEIALLAMEFNAMAEQVEGLIQAKERLLQDISHELRSPLARLQIASELIRKSSSSSNKSECDRIDRECEKLNLLIREILDFARIQQRYPKTRIKKTDLKSLLEQIINDTNYEYCKTTPRVFAAPLPRIEAWIDANLIHRAIENIIRNALIHSSPDSPVKLSVTKDLKAKTLTLTIEDEGPGVPQEELLHIFSPFYRIDNPQMPQTKGFGLGLAIATEAIKRHQGQIRAYNRAPHGLGVEITLPLGQWTLPPFNNESISP